MGLVYTVDKLRHPASALMELHHMSTNDKVRALVRVCLDADKSVSNAATMFDKKAHSALGIMERGAKSYGPITSAIFNADIREPLSEAMKDSKRYTDAVRKVTLSYHCKALIGLSQPGTTFAPIDGESEQPYVKRITEALKQAKLFVPSNKGGNGGKRKPAKGDKRDGKGVTVTREGALVKLVGKNAADRQMVDFLVSKHMDKLRTLYGTLVPADAVA